MLHAEGKKQRDPLLLSLFMAHERSSFLGLTIRAIPLLLSALIAMGLVFLAHGTGYTFIAGTCGVGLIVLAKVLLLRYG